MVWYGMVDICEGAPGGCCLNRTTRQHAPLVRPARQQYFTDKTNERESVCEREKVCVREKVCEREKV